jgi:hypothetical protein
VIEVVQYLFDVVFNFLSGRRHEQRRITGLEDYVPFTPRLAKGEKAGYFYRGLYKVKFTGIHCKRLPQVDVLTPHEARPLRDHS